ncbi:AT-rich interactive domain-containing protein 5B [Bulinus truncatus]|nr:AT-rich interactive domain-containing protein 5B [Bulinus truncatus]
MFYKAFKYKSSDINRILAIGDFFFLKILQEICIGEIELLWEDKTANQLLASLRLYFRPEHTPEGRQGDTGEDEVLVLGERLVLKLDDLVPLIEHNVKWAYGSSVCSFRDSDNEIDIKTPRDSLRNIEYENKKDGCEKVFDDCLSRGICGDLKNGVVKEENGKKRNCTLSVFKMEDAEHETNEKLISGAVNIAILSYPKYCRYRAMRKRLEGCENQWLHLAIVVAIGGFTGRAPGCRVMFCRDTFEHTELDSLEIRMDHMMPVLKNRSKGKKTKLFSRKDSQQDSDSMEEMFSNVTPSVSSSSRPRRSTESSEINEDKVSTEEQAFLIGLHKFMHDAKMPIGRIPSLGFKQIDLFYFYKQAEKLGGYDLITHKRMWKHLYDKLGGNSSNTSAATCTRKHYERLLLPYERHLRKMKSLKVRKKQTYLNDTLDIPDIKDNGNQTSQKENVELIERPNVEQEKQEIDDFILSKTVDKDEDKPLTAQENLSEDSAAHKDNNSTSLSEHSKLDLQGETEVLEIPVIGHCIGGNSAFPALELKSVDSANIQNLQFPHLEQLQHQQHHHQLGKTSGLQQNSTLPGDNPCLINANLMLRGGYLMPVLTPHMLQSQWGLMTPSPSSTSASSPQIIADGFFPQAGTSDNSSAPSSRTNNQNLGPEGFYKVGGGKSSQSHQPSLSSGSSAIKTAHSNTPNKSSLNVLNDHIHPGNIPNKSYPYPNIGPSDLLGVSSQNLSPILHPKPPGYRPQSHLPPAPSTVYLNPTSANPYLALQSSMTSPPPFAHKYPRKRPYPYDNADTQGAAFPSPDMVLDRIKNSTSLPHSVSVQATINKQQKIQQQLNSPYGPLPPLELQQPYSQQVHTNSKVLDQIRSPSIVNGLLQNQQQSSSKSLPSTHQVSPVASSSKEGRLTSALFGTQFTAMPRATKSSDHPAPHLSDPSLNFQMNSHLHPAFMNLYMPSGAHAPVTNINPQLQMIANAYGTTPAQLAAYDEMVRQNGYSPFLTSPQQQMKNQKKK